MGQADIQNSIETEPEQTNSDDFDNPFNTEFFSDEDYLPLFDSRRNRRSAPSPKNNSSKQKQSNESILTIHVFSLLTFICVASIFRVVSASQISNIKLGVNDLANRQTLIVHQLEQNSKEILVNRNMIDGLKCLNLKLVKFTTVQHFESSGMLKYILMTAEYAHIDDALNQYVQIIEASANHRLHQAFYPTKVGLQPLKKFEQLLKLEVSPPLSTMHSN